MFTGIVQGIGQVESVEKKAGLNTLSICFPEGLTGSIALGASVAVNGCCLTVTSVNGQCITFDAMQETLAVTNIGKIEQGSRVNLERAAHFGDEIGGHQVSGHIFCQAGIVERTDTENNCTVWFSLPEKAKPYILHKGYIAIDGASLTVGEVLEGRFCVHLIPETLERTIISDCCAGYRVNIEVDPQTQVVVDTVERLLKARLQNKAKNIAP